MACSNDCLDCIDNPRNYISCNPDKYLSGNICLCKTKLWGLSHYIFSIKKYISCSGSLANQCSESRIMISIFYVKKITLRMVLLFAKVRYFLYFQSVSFDVNQLFVNLAQI